MADRPDTNIEDLGVVMNSLSEANNSLRRVIERSTNEVGQLEKFEDKFKDASDKFYRFKEFVQKNNKQAETLKSRFDQDISYHRQYAELLKRQIGQLRKAIDEQASENDKLNQQYKINIEKLHELKKKSDQSAIQTKSPQPFIQRLQNELE